MIFVGGGQGWFGVVAIFGVLAFLMLPALARAFFGIFDRPTDADRKAEFDQTRYRDRIVLPEPREWSCSERFCRTHNPSHARFCRNCGKRRPPRELFNKVA